MSLRIEAGLLSPVGREFEVFDEVLGERILARVNSEGKLEPVRRLFDRDPAVVLVGTSDSEVDRESTRYGDRLARKNVDLTFGDRLHVPERRVRTNAAGRRNQASTLFGLLEREAAKIAIEFVGLTSGPDVALSEELDSVRACATDGTSLVGALFLRPPGRLWLPRSRIAVEFPSADASAMNQEPAKLLTEGGQEKGEPLIDIWHELRLVQDVNACWFALMLFGCLGAIIPLPCDLPIHWGPSESRDFLGPAPLFVRRRRWWP